MGLGVEALLAGPLTAPGLTGLEGAGRQEAGSKDEAVADSFVVVLLVFSGVLLMKGSLSWMTDAIESMEATRWMDASKMPYLEEWSLLSVLRVRAFSRRDDLAESS